MAAIVQDLSPTFLTLSPASIGAISIKLKPSQEAGIHAVYV